MYIKKNNGFIVRAANFSKSKRALVLLNEFSEAKEYEYKALLKKVSMLPDIKEAIMVASTSLFKAISNVDSLNDKKLKSTFFSTYEYLKRAVNRATPFGIFSSVYKNADYIQKANKENFIRHVRLSPEWLLAVYSDVIDQIYLFPKQKISLSASAIIKGNYLINYIIGENPVFKDHEEIRYQKNAIIQAIIRIFDTDDHPSVIQIISTLLSSVKNININSAIKILKQLMIERLLIGELYPLRGFALSEFERYIQNIEKLGNRFSIIDDLKQVLSLGEEYEKKGGSERYINLFCIMSDLHDTKKKIIVDSEGINRENITNNISDSNIKDIKNLANFLYHNAQTIPGYDSMILNGFKERLAERYDYDHFVSLLQVFSEMGSPYYDVKYSQKYLNYQKRLSAWIATNIALNTKNNEIHLENFTDINLSTSKSYPEYTDPSFDLNFYYYKYQKQDLFILGQNPSSLLANDFNGRFSYFLYPNIKNIKEKSYFSSIQYIPKNNKVANIYYNKLRYTNNIIINGYNNKDISVSKIYISVNKNNKIEFVDDKGQFLAFDQQNMANPSFENDIVRFIITATCPNLEVEEFITQLRSFSGLYRKRMVYNSIVVAPACWKIPKAIVKDSVNKVRSTLKELNVPNLINLVHLDRILPLDLRSDTDVLLLIKYHKDKNNIEENLYLEERLDKYANSFFEVTIPFHSDNMNNNLTNKKSCHANHEDESKRYPSNWFYVKLYLPKGEGNNFITSEVFNFINSNKIRYWFFIRYTDPKFHIRFRFKYSDKRIINQALEWIESLRSKAIIDDYQIVPYYRELERYGGAEIYDNMEKLFMLDSICIVEILKTVKLKKLNNLQKDTIVLWQLKEVLKSVLINPDIKLKVLRTKSLKDKELKKKFKALENFIAQIDYHEISEISGITKQMIQQINNILTKRILDSNVSNTTVEDWLDSIIHMHFNRLNGAARFEDEMRAQEFRLLRQYYWLQENDNEGNK